MELLHIFFSGILILVLVKNIQTFEGCLCLEELAKDLKLPVSLVHANDGSNRLFVAELYGVVHIFHQNGTMLSEPFIDIRSRIGPLAKISEEGIGDIAFHPNFKSNGLFYMLFSTPTTITEVNHYSNLAEFRVSGNDANKADSGYFRLLLQIPQPHWPHNADKLLFGVDGYLYIFVGDGGFQRDIHMYTQNMDKFLGKVLRIDVDSRTDDLPYGIPPDNPFINGSYPHPEIYALGLRNPWRCGMDNGDRETGKGRGRIICGDVGQHLREELNLIEKGANYGWNKYEGPSVHCKFCQLGPGDLRAPIFSYHRNDRLGKAVIGGQFYRGCRSPRLNGLYIWGDFYSGLLFGLLENETTGAWENREIEMCDESVCHSPMQQDYAANIASFGIDEDGEVYLLAMEGKNPYDETGHVYRFVDPFHPGNPEECRQISKKQQTKVKETSLLSLSDNVKTTDEHANEILNPPAHRQNEKQSQSGQVDSGIHNEEPPLTVRMSTTLETTLLKALFSTESFTAFTTTTVLPHTTTPASNKGTPSTTKTTPSDTKMPLTTMTMSTTTAPLSTSLETTSPPPSLTFSATAATMSTLRTPFSDSVKEYLLLMNAPEAPTVESEPSPVPSGAESTALPLVSSTTEDLTANPVNPSTDHANQNLNKSTVPSDTTSSNPLMSPSGGQSTVTAAPVNRSDKRIFMPGNNVISQFLNYLFKLNLGPGNKIQ